MIVSPKNMKLLIAEVQKRTEFKDQSLPKLEIDLNEESPIASYYLDGEFRLVFNPINVGFDKFTPEMWKGVIAHEFGHWANGDVYTLPLLKDAASLRDAESKADYYAVSIGFGSQLLQAFSHADDMAIDPADLTHPSIATRIENLHHWIRETNQHLK